MQKNLLPVTCLAYAVGSPRSLCVVSSSPVASSLLFPTHYCCRLCTSQAVPGTSQHLAHRTRARPLLSTIAHTPPPGSLTSSSRSLAHIGARPVSPQPACCVALKTSSARGTSGVLRPRCLARNRPSLPSSPRKFSSPSLSHQPTKSAPSPPLPQIPLALESKRVSAVYLVASC